MAWSKYRAWREVEVLIQIHNNETWVLMEAVIDIKSNVSWDVGAYIQLLNYFDFYRLSLPARSAI